MSHTTKLDGVEIKDIAALRQAVQTLKSQGVNCELVEKARPRMYYGNQGANCDYVLQLKDTRFDVGFEKTESGAYAPVFDEWNNYVGSQIGASCPLPDTEEGKAKHQIGKLMQEYAKNAATNAAIAQGYMVEMIEVDPEGNVHLTLGGM